MPHLARLAARAEVGRAEVIPPGLPPGSDVGNMAILGYDPARYHTGRAPIEAAAMGVELGPDEVAYRCNLVTLSEDDPALMVALKSPAFYVGALGSKKNNDSRRKRLADFDLSADEIARMRGPVGLRIGSKTPPEIAVAILAEMTAVRHGVQIPELIEPPKVNVTSGCAVPQT